ncbi:MAG TPA: hypothetical protein VMO26_20345 [Vicinamibacterales bacterium]|nr:hypothetical protein [Vicinamibacterales bacterium]
MWTRAARWAVAALMGSAMTTIGCGRAMVPDEPRWSRQPIIADESLTHAFIDVANHLGVRPPG